MTGTRLYLRRIERIPDGVFGRLTASGLSLVTAEDDWNDNKPNISCIPAGTYPLRRCYFNKHHLETFGVFDVPGRSLIRIHPGNTEEDTEGCILPGLRLGPLRVVEDEDTHVRNVIKRAALSSVVAHQRFMEAMADVDEGLITIEWAPQIDPARLVA
jgi:hypothetical protein